jgi:hypothetical protein
MLLLHVTTRPLDTSEKAWKQVDEGLRRMTPAERVGRAISLTIFAHALALAQIRRMYPAEDERRWRMRLAARMTEPALMKAAFGWPHD